MNREALGPWRKLANRSTMVFAMLALIGSGVFAYAVDDYRRQPTRLHAQAERTASAESAEIAEAIKTELLDVEREVGEIVGLLESGELGREGIELEFRQRLDANAGLFGLAAIYAPLQEEDRDLFGPYCRREGSGIRKLMLEEEVDYTLPDPGPEFSAGRTHWFQEPMKRGTAWLEPYFCALGETLMVTYGEHLFLPSTSGFGREAVAVADLALGRVREILAGFPVGLTGYAFIVSDGGRLVAHPNRRFLGQLVEGILLDASESGKPDVEALRQFAGKPGASPEAGKTNATEEDPAFVLVKIPIDAAGWTLGTVYDPKEIVQTNDAERRSRTVILLAVFPLIIGIVGCFFPSGVGRTKLFVIAGVLSLMSVSGIGLLWLWSIEYPSDTDSQVLPVRDESTTNAVLARLLPSGPDDVPSDWELADRIATGIFVQSAKFLGPYNVAVTGYIWQRFDDGRALESVPAVVFPEAETLSMERVTIGDDFVRWYFEANLRQVFDYATYPIDREIIWIRLWPANFDEAVILTPDFAAYDDMARANKPGLEKAFVLEGWDCVGTHFSYRANSYRANFGDAAYAEHNDRPELYFNIDVRRKFIGPFIADLMPMLVVVVLLFAVLMIETRKDADGLLKCNASNLLSNCARFFFVVIVSHVYVRQKLAVPQVIYIEWFYFTVYGLLLLLSLNAVSFARGRYVRLFGLENAQLVALAYWPITLGVLFLVTLLTFVG